MMAFVFTIGGKKKDSVSGAKARSSEKMMRRKKRMPKHTLKGISLCGSCRSLSESEIRWVRNLALGAEGNEGKKVYGKGPRRCFSPQKDAVDTGPIWNRVERGKELNARHLWKEVYLTQSQDSARFTLAKNGGASPPIRFQTGMGWERTFYREEENKPTEEE